MAGDGPPAPAAPSMFPVGFVRSSASGQTVHDAWADLQSEIEILPEYEAALLGIDGFSHLFVLFFMHKLGAEERKLLQVKPRGLLRYGLTLPELPTIGVFACDSPARPNPIGLSVVQLLDRRANVLTVQGLDAFDGAPVLDLKPYTADRVVKDLRTPAWHEELLRKSLAPRV